MQRKLESMTVGDFLAFIKTNGVNHSAEMRIQAVSEDGIGALEFPVVMILSSNCLVKGVNIDDAGIDVATRWIVLGTQERVREA